MKGYIRMTANGIDILPFNPNENAIPKKYIIKNDITILIWDDNSKTIIRRGKDDVHDKRLAFLTAYFQKHSGLSKNKANKYLDSLVDEDEQLIINFKKVGVTLKEAVKSFEKGIAKLHEVSRQKNND